MSTLRTNTLSNAAGSASVPVDTVISGSAKAWVNFNGAGTVAIRASFNVSSITDNGTGDYTVNFTTAFPNTNYVVATSTGYFGTTSSEGARSLSIHTYATGSVRVVDQVSTGVSTDQEFNNLVVFR